MNDSAAAAGLVREILANERECEWIEYKENNEDPEMIGKLISALANSAALFAQPRGITIWGVRDGSREVDGTTFGPDSARFQKLRLFLAQNLDPDPLPEFCSVELQGKRVCLMQVPCSMSRPVRFKGEAYIRIGESVTPLRSHPERERQLFRRLDERCWESAAAISNVDGPRVMALLDTQSYFERTAQPFPSSWEASLRALEADSLIATSSSGCSISNLGASLFGVDLASFPRLAAKKLRVAVYEGQDRERIRRPRDFSGGYAAAFPEAMEWISSQLPGNEHIGRVIRESVTVYPPEALREIVANAIIHQDFAISGSRPLVEIFSDRIEIYNPGVPLVEPSRFLDHPPQARNERLSGFMRRMRYCEEMGTGVDRTLKLIELFQLPAPKFEREGDGVRVTLYAPREYKRMSGEDKLRAAYQHAGLRHVAGETPMTNSTLRHRFGLGESQQSAVSKIIAAAIDQGLIKRHRPDDTSKKHAQYLPFWA